MGFQDSSAIEAAFATYGKESQAKYTEKIETLHQQVRQAITTTNYE
ncbi:MAG: hypothetical protein AAF223_15780 [Bacteroidota bacterium]